VIQINVVKKLSGTAIHLKDWEKHALQVGWRGDQCRREKHSL